MLARYKERELPRDCGHLSADLKFADRVMGRNHKRRKQQSVSASQPQRQLQQQPLQPTPPDPQTALAYVQGRLQD